MNAPGVSIEDHLKILRKINEATGKECTLFMANRILNNLWIAYEEAVRKDPTMTTAVYEGDFTFQGRI